MVSRIQRYKCFESRSHAEEEQQGHHPLQWRIFQFRAPPSNHSLSESALSTGQSQICVKSLEGLNPTNENLIKN